MQLWCVEVGAESIWLSKDFAAATTCLLAPARHELELQPHVLN